jgi:hypothetical protein
MTRFVETLMDEINKLKYENMFLGQQLAQQNGPRFKIPTDVQTAKRSNTATTTSAINTTNPRPIVDRTSEVIVRHFPVKEVRHSRRHRRVEREVRGRAYSPVYVGVSTPRDTSPFGREVDLRRSSYSTVSSASSVVSSSVSEPTGSAETIGQKRKFSIVHKINGVDTELFHTLPPTIMRKRNLRSRRWPTPRTQGCVVYPELNLERSNFSFHVLRIYNTSDIPHESEEGLQSNGERPGISGTARADGKNAPRPSKECIAYFSDHLLEALMSCAQCEIQESDTSIALTHSTPQLLPPYHFIYHHRHRLEEYAREYGGPAREDIENLLTCVGDSFGESFNEADQLFARGMVTQDHLLRLFTPNTPIFSRKFDQAYMLSSWPRLLGHRLSLNCWSWKYDGTGVFRQTTSLEVVCDGGTPVRITDLECYPLKFADPDLRKSTLHCGRTFWDLKEPGLVCYNGSNVDDTDSHVSIFWPLRLS